MVTKAIIEEIVDDYSVRVRIPYFNKLATSVSCTPTEDLYIATICCPPNSTLNYKVGDIVFLAYEEGQANKPVILGQLSRATKTDNNPTYIAESITVKADANLPIDTCIGDISPTDIQQLKGVKENLQFQLDILTARIAKLEDQLNDN